MNILFASNAPFIPTIGGVERVTDLLCKEFLKLGHNCYYITFRSSLTTDIEDEYEYPCPYTLIDGTVNDTTSFSLYHSKLDELKIDVIICQEGYYEYSHFFLNIGCRKIKRIVVLHNDPNMHYNHVWEELYSLKNNTLLENVKRFVRPIMYFKFKRLYRNKQKTQLQFLNENCDKIVFLSPSYIESASKFYRPILLKSIAIPNPNTYKAQTIDLSKKLQECVFVGRLDNKSKNLCSLLKIWEKVQKLYPHCQLSIVGTGPDELLLKDFVRNRDIRSVTFYSRQNPVPYYERASLFCMTSRYEGFPMCIPEAMCYGCVPMVFGSFASVNDIITNGIDGIIIKAFDEKDYASQIVKILNDRERLHNLATNALKSVQRFDMSQISDKWVNMLNSLLDES